MKQSLILSVFLFSAGFFSLGLACHPSCNCLVNHVCDSCVVPGSTIDANKRSCPCPLGTYTSSLSPFECAAFVNVDANGDDISSEAGACDLELNNNIGGILVQCDSNISADVDKKSIVTNQITLDTSHISVDPQCLDDLSIEFLYLNPTTSAYEPLDPQYFTINGLTLTIQIPLIKLDEIFGAGPLNAYNQFTNVAHFLIKIKTNGNVIRLHTWDLFVYTNRDEVEVFTVQDHAGETDGCQEGQECIVIADLDTVATVCSDDTCTAVRPNLIYTVADFFIAKICFKDPTYTKNLEFVNLFFKNDENKVFRFTDITTTNQENYCLIVKLPLVEPSLEANIQIDMLIQDSRRVRRTLADNATTALTSKATFVASILSSTDTTTNTDDNNESTSNSSAASLFFLGFLNAVAFLCIF